MTALPVPLLSLSSWVIGLLLAAWTLLFLFRIVLSWYPQMSRENPLVAFVVIPTEPLLALTRKVIPPIGGVDVTPVIWFGELAARIAGRSARSGDSDGAQSNAVDLNPKRRAAPQNKASDSGLRTQDSELSISCSTNLVWT